MHATQLRMRGPMRTRADLRFPDRDGRVRSDGTRELQRRGQGVLCDLVDQTWQSPRLREDVHCTFEAWNEID